MRASQSMVGRAVQLARVVAATCLTLLLAAADGAAESALPDLPLSAFPELKAGPAEIGWALDGQVDPASYRLGPGDRLLLRLEGRKRREISLTVLPQGILSWEGGLSLETRGLSLAEAEAAATEQLSPWMPDVEIRLLLIEPRRIQVHVLGAVVEPGVVELRATDRVSSAIRMAGGALPFGSLRFVELVDENGGRERRDLYPYLLSGELSANPYCPSGRTIFVPVRTDTVQVMGEVNRPGTYEWRGDETLGDFLGYARGFTQDALPESILLERGETNVVVRMLNSEAGSFQLRPSDILIVGSRRPLRKRVFLEGAGERQGEVYLSPDETLGDLVKRLGDTRGSALPDQAILERKGADRSDFFRFNLRELLLGNGPVDMPIQADDVLFVPVRSRQVFVLGEVEQPGSFSYDPSWTAAQFLAMAGGTTNRGSDGNLKVVSSDGSEREVEASDHLHRGDILIIGKSKFSILSDVILTTVSVTSLILAINALSK